ncbi:phospholipase [Saccharomonospora piscinae]|uniref:phospholipase A2 n=1 Tax=Saccharomonospora piscinae TaxID=687388 RepID=UPI001106E955|nr:phospholipase A2 [Saccharomonospora piscinae]TLW92071.1 phospholipase [Saccharomonospora piscinae]
MPASRIPRPRRRLPRGRVARLLLLVLVVAGFGVIASRPEAEPPPHPGSGDVTGSATGSNPAAERAVEALLDPRRSAEALALLPPDFAAITRVEAATERALDGTIRAVHVGGGCSAPWGDDSTRWNFGTPCRSHDLGYDLLRYAERKGEPLAPELRESLDHRLSADMAATCDANPLGTHSLCRSVASVYTAGLVANSWYQRWGPPVGEPLLPLLAGVTAIGVLSWHRLRDRPAPQRWALPRLDLGRWRRSLPPATPWTLLGVAALVTLILGESAVRLATWAGIDGAWLWPLTWAAQTTVVFFFAAGHANASTWTQTRLRGGGVRTYLSHRGSALLRLTLVFAVAASTVPLALELLRIPPATGEAVVRTALHPLWLLGFHVLTVVLTPAMLTLHRRAPAAVPLALILALAAAEWLSTRTAASWPHHAGTLTLALLAQQAAFAHREGLVPSRSRMALAGVSALAALGLGVATGTLPATVLGVDDAPPALSGPTTAVLLLGVVHLAALGLLRRRLVPIVHRPSVLRQAGLAARAPMTLYLLYLAALLLLLAAVYLPRRLEQGLGWSSEVQPRLLLAIALLTAPAVLVFAWFERQRWHQPPPPVWTTAPGVLGRALSHAATAAGFGFAVLGVFGFALTTLDAEPPWLRGVLLDPVQSVVHLLLGMSLLHSVRTATTHSPLTWLLTALACVPPLLSVTSEPSPDTLGLFVHAGACVLGGAALGATTVSALVSPGRGAR